MAKVSLDQIWQADAKQLAPVLETQGREPSDDLKMDRVVSAMIYYNAGMLDPKDAIYVTDPQFVTVMRTVNNLQVGKELLLTPVEEKEPEEILQGNEGLVQHFRTLADLYTSIKEEHKANAFNGAAVGIEQVPYTITLANYKELGGKGSKKIKGIGASSLDEIKEYLQTGTSKRLEQLLNQTASQRDIISLFKGVYGIGTATALDLYKKGYRTIESLAKAPLTHAQRAGLKWYNDLKERIPRSEMDEWIDRLIPVLGPTEGVEGKSNPWLVAGSYRRGEASSGDIDILMRNDTNNPNALSDAVQKLQEAGLLLDVLALGDKKFMGIVRLGSDRVARRIDIRLFEPSVWAYALLYNTGSQRVNILMRQQAQSMDLTLNEYRLMNPSTAKEEYPAETEEDIFKYLGIKYLSPEERTKDLAALTLTS